MTGRVHIDLKARVIQTEKEISLEEKVVKGLSSTFKVLPWLADFAFQRSLDYIQLFDLDLLLSSAAFDDNKAMENLTDKVNECGEYVKSMAIFDLDSLVGVNDNESISNMVRGGHHGVSELTIHRACLPHIRSTTIACSTLSFKLQSEPFSTRTASSGSSLSPSTRS